MTPLKYINVECFYIYKWNVESELSSITLYQILSLFWQVLITNTFKIWSRTSWRIYARLKCNNSTGTQFNAELLCCGIATHRLSDPMINDFSAVHFMVFVMSHLSNISFPAERVQRQHPQSLQVILISLEKPEVQKMKVKVCWCVKQMFWDMHLCLGVKQLFPAYLDIYFQYPL